MSSLYPSTLFHFTNKQGLWGILNETFILSYAREKIVGQNNKFREYAVPMVSFCDIKLADLNHFIKKKYGFYGIGLTKEWANRKGLNPVIYMNSNCELINNYIDGMSGMFNSIQSVNEIIDLDQFNSGIQNYNYLSNIYRYMKNYEGELIRKEKIVDTNYRFADEREWRYIPSMETNGVYSFVNISLIKTQEQKKEWNSKIRHIKLVHINQEVLWDF